MSKPASIWRSGDLSARFIALSELLVSHQHWWRPRAFFQPVLPWESLHPQLSVRLRQLPFADSEHIAADNKLLLDFFGGTAGPLQTAAFTIADLCAIGALPARDMADVAEARDVPGRKWQQILAFTAVLPDTALPATEWCAGKAHLGRHYTRLGGAAVDALEYKRSLVDAGNEISQRESLPATSHCVDVLRPAANDFLRGERQVLALHACGQLHLHLLHECTTFKPRAIALAPCCYQLQDDDFYAPLSIQARKVALPLSRLDLHTAVQESVTSPERVLRQRRQLQAWRLGFDVLQREVRGVDDYLHTPSQPLSILHNGFEQFCLAMARHCEITVPTTTDFLRYEHLGQGRLIEVTALDLPRMLFRRALELWLVLDRALYLQQSGYDVSVGTFCERALTPRNLLIQAWRS
ncbi:MAG: methyltransferase [Spongiibacteraceae bacterium]